MRDNWLSSGHGPANSQVSEFSWPWWRTLENKWQITSSAFVSVLNLEIQNDRLLINKLNPLAIIKEQEKYLKYYYFFPF